jgi:hypothetical protein
MFYLQVFTAILFLRHLDGGTQSAPIVFVKCGELEWLQTPWDRTQHLHSAEYGPRRRYKHELRLSALTQLFGQAQQAAGDRDHMQSTRDAPTDRESEHGWSVFRQVHSRGTA